MTSSKEAVVVRRPPFIYASILFLIGAFLLIGGIQLAMLGGSPYYIISGALVLVSAYLLFRRRKLGAQLYGLMLAGTILWSFWEVGLEPYGLASRIVAPAVLGIWLLMPWTRRRLT